MAILGLRFHFNRRFRCVAVTTGIFTLTVYAVLSYSTVQRYQKQQPGARITNDRFTQQYPKYPHKNTLPPKRAIPKIIHQIWSDDVIPEEFVEHVKSVVQYNPYPQWEYYFWTLDVGREFIKKKFPKMLKIYDAAKILNKAEFLRLAVIFYYGGAYFDLDVFCLRPLDRYVDNHECSLIAPIPEFYVAYNQPLDPFEVNNAIFLCRAGHPFFKILVSRKEMLSKSCFSNSSDSVIKISEDCNVIEFARPHLAKLAATGNRSALPELADFRMFDSMYDPAIENLLEEKCTTSKYFHLEKKRRDICDNWLKQGKGNRSIPENAYTYHTWYHTKQFPVTIAAKNRIQKIVPHAKVYDHILDRHFMVG